MITIASLLVSVLLQAAPERMTPTVHSVSDISQKFTFYMDGRFHRQYLEGVGRDMRNWGSLDRLDLSNVNLLILTDGNERIPYEQDAIDHIVSFVEGGGCVLLMMNGDQPGNDLAKAFDARSTTERGSRNARGTDRLKGTDLDYRGGTVFEFGDDWTVLAVDDRSEKPLLAMRRVGKGHVVIGARGLFGQKPDASDPINKEWVGPLLAELAESKPIDPKKPHRRTWVEHARAIGPLTLEYHDGTEPFADAIYEVYTEVRPHLEVITGCEPSPGMVKSLLVLPTGGGGFSSGARIAIGAWWGNYPEKRYPMVELIAHEAGHSWVLPHAEPLWNEPIATYLGIQVGRRMDMAQADETLGRQIAKGRRHDPDYDAIDPLSEGAPRDVIWGKSYFVFEELRRLHGEDFMAKYFAAKRRLITRDRPSYSMDDCVAVWSVALETDLFPWFRSLAFDVDRERTDIELNQGRS